MMLRLVLASLVCLTCVAVEDPALAKPGHGGFGVAAANCTQGLSYPNDGCAALYAANLQGTVQYGDALTNTAYGPASGQTYTTRAPWNMAGVDFPVGVPAAQGTLIDPAVTQPTNCTYSATGSSASGPKLSCSGGAVSIVGYEFGPVGGHLATVLRVSSTATSLDIEKSHFQNDSNTNSSSALGDYPLYLATTSSTFAVTLKYNTFNGECSTGASCTLNNYGFVLYTTGAVTEEYNAFIYMPSRQSAGCASGACTTAGDLNIDHNFWLGLCEACNSGFHGEIIEQVWAQSGTPTTQGNVNYKFNTVIIPPTENHGTTVAYVSGGAANIGGPTYSHVLIDSNTFIANLFGGSGGTVSYSSLVDFINGYFPDTTVTNNYFDKTGASGNIETEGVQGNFTGVIDGSGVLTVTGFTCAPGGSTSCTGIFNNQRLWYSSADSGIVVTVPQLTNTQAARGTLTSATVAGSVISYVSLSGSIKAGDWVTGAGITAGTTFVSQVGSSNAWNISASFTVGTPETVTSNPPQKNGTYQTSGASVASINMKNFDTTGDAVFYSAPTISGNYNMVTGATANTFDYIYNDYVPLP